MSKIDGGFENSFSSQTLFAFFRRPERKFWLSVFDRLINVSDCNDSSVLDGIITDLQLRLAEPTRRKEIQEILSVHSHIAALKN